jgi:hypothetical protein
VVLSGVGSCAIEGVGTIEGGGALVEAIPLVALFTAWTASMVDIYDRAKILTKYANERARILEKSSETPGFQYSLRATISGEYPNVRGGTTYLKAGDVWKYGKTTLGDSIYSRDELSATGLGLKMFPEFYGNDITIRLMEKSKIYAYFMFHFKLPPGNRIFR